MVESPSSKTAIAAELALAQPASRSCGDLSSELRGGSVKQALSAISEINFVTEMALTAKPTDEVVAATCLEVLFEALDNFKDEPEVMRTVWRGLSMHAFVNPAGAALVANTRGPMNGIVFILEQMRAHPEPYLAEDPRHLTLRYEMMQTVHGILEHDTGHTYGAALLREGLTEQLLQGMRSEPDLRGTQEVACNCMEWLSYGNPDALPVFEEGGAVKLLLRALESFGRKVDPTPVAMCPYFTLGDVFPVVPPCGKVLVKLAQTSPRALNEMGQCGVLGLLADVRPELVTTIFPLRLQLEELLGTK